MGRKLIYDVGMHDGADTAYYLAKGFNVVAIEANPKLVLRAQETFNKEIRQGRLVIIDKAIGQKGGTIRFGVHSKNDEWSSTDASRLKRFAEDMSIIEVECVTLDSVISQYGCPHYLKIDIEGADLQAIEALGQLKKRPKYVSAEAHTGLIAKRLHEFGYRKFMLVDQAAKNVKAPRRLWFFREGRYVRINFTDSHSGPFGKEAPGKWVTIDEVLQDHDEKVATGKLTWHDFHAAL